MNKILPFFLLLILLTGFSSEENQFIARQGHVSFFSYASMENIEAQNNQVLSILDLRNKKIAVSMLMRAFVFKKDLMYEHFNESYIESDIYPKATFEGNILDFESSLEKQTKIVRGNLTIHGNTKEIDIKTTIEKINGTYLLSGEYNVFVKDFDIKIPPILSSNIAKMITIKFRFQYQSYEE
ncbi:YceI family protein [Polaribacter sp. Hel1_85]|uniref:YceI family protein n=1 Tax=Polaribacter sp. Hel1_85 TaxID=1250005 RepID=UPI00052C9826|nr:YceI family protein [Polaribacter sp. Hel1_85]KGL64153.1 YceI family protein [Polaribacter sp. Hel1_85]